MIHDRCVGSATPCSPVAQRMLALDSAIIRERRTMATRVAGWGPKVFIAFAFAALSNAPTTIFAAPAVASSTGAPCADRVASVLDAATPEWPTFAHEFDMHGTVKLAIDLASDAAVTNVAVAKSSGFVPLNREALRVGAASTFAPAVTKCKRQPGTYAFFVNFAR